MCTMSSSTSVKTLSNDSSISKRLSKRQRQNLKSQQEKTKIEKKADKLKKRKLQRAADKQSAGAEKKLSETKPSGYNPKKKNKSSKSKTPTSENGLSEKKPDKVVTGSKPIKKRKAPENKTDAGAPVKKLQRTDNKKAQSNKETTIKPTVKKKEKPKKVKNPPSEKKSADSPGDPEVEPDRNWKLLSKQLGIDPYQRKSEEKPEEKEAEEEIISETEEIKSKEPEIWFDGVDEMLIEGKFHVEAHTTENEKPVKTKKGKPSKGSSKEELEEKLIIKTGSKGLTKYLAMDCEMVGVGPGGHDSVLARISIVNQFGYCVYDKFVKPQEEVTDHRTWVSGVRPEDLIDAEEISVVQKEVDVILKGRVLVGHAITNDEKVLFMNHPKRYIRDTQKYPGYRKLVGGKRPGLKMLSKRILGINIQSGEHSSVQDAQATMRLFMLIRQTWEKLIKDKKFIQNFKKEKQVEAVVKKLKKGQS